MSTDYAVYYVGLFVQNFGSMKMCGCIGYIFACWINLSNIPLQRAQFVLLIVLMYRLRRTN